MMKRIWMVVCLAALAACVVKPPVQEMAEARSAVQAAQSVGDAQSGEYLKRAQASLQQASKAIEQRKYAQARAKALQAKKLAQQAAKVSQKEH